MPGLSEFKCNVNLKPQSHVDSVLGSKGRLRGGSMNPTSISWAFFFLSSSSSQGSCGNSVTYHRDTGHHTNPTLPRGCPGSRGDTRQTVLTIKQRGNLWQDCKCAFAVPYPPGDPHVCTQRCVQGSSPQGCPPNLQTTQNPSRGAGRNIHSNGITNMTQGVG